MNPWDLAEAREYIKFHAIDFEDALDIEDDVLTNRLNVALRTLTRAFRGGIIPKEAVYLFTAVLSAAYNDTMVMQKRGVNSFSVSGIAFTFKQWASDKDLTDLITDEISFIIEEENPDIDFGRGRIKWVTL